MPKNHEDFGRHFVTFEKIWWMWKSVCFVILHQNKRHVLNKKGLSYNTNYIHTQLILWTLNESSALAKTRYLTHSIICFTWKHTHKTKLLFTKSSFTFLYLYENKTKTKTNTKPIYWERFRIVALKLYGITRKRIWKWRCNVISSAPNIPYTAPE